MSHLFENATEEYLSRVQRASAHTEHAREAYLFVLQTTFGQIYPTCHVDAEEYCWRIHDYSISAYGGDARRQLESWGINSTMDFGAIIYALIDEGLMQKSEQDSIEDFQDVFSFDDEFIALKFPASGIGGLQWRLRTLFGITTVVCIAFAGASKFGFNGAVGALFSTWLAIVGVSCIVLGVINRSKDWMILVFVGMLFFLAGIGGLMMITMR